MTQSERGSTLCVCCIIITTMVGQESKRQMLIIRAVDSCSLISMTTIVMSCERKSMTLSTVVAANRRSGNFSYKLNNIATKVHSRRPE